jgi:lysophospholipase L1-like esterase
MSTSRDKLNPWVNVAIVVVSLAVALLLGEIGLRLFAKQPHPYTEDGTTDGPVVYSEFQRSRVNIYVPNRRPPGSRTIRPNPEIVHGLSREVTFTVGRFGFRSARPVSLRKPEGVTRIMAVGGSTTENNLLDDSEVWTEVLHGRLARQRPGVEVINVGRSGDTTRDHIAVLAQRLVPFEPDIVIFLVGVNDLELQMKPDYSTIRKDRRSLAGDGTRIPLRLLVKVWASDRSHVARLAILSLRRALTEDERGNPIEDPTSSWVAMKREEYRRLPARNVDVSLWPKPEYEQNLRTLIGISRAHRIVPVLITQPAIWGAPSGAWESMLWVHPHPDYRIPHAQLWTLLESFNDVTRRVARESGVLLIDLARLLPKTSEVFTDDDHYTVVGSRMVANLIASRLEQVNWARLR